MVVVANVTRSAQARELASRLTQTVEQYRQEHPELRSRDVAGAFALAGAGCGVSDRRRRAGVAAALAGAFAALAAGLGSHSARTGGMPTIGSIPWIYVVVGVVVVVLVIVAIVLAKANASSD